MTPWPAASIGDPLGAVDTPALVLDLDAFERNLARMSAALRGRTVRLRPHAKSHKCPEIALLQIAQGAVGICCQKLSEAAVFVAAGVKDVLITNQVMGRTKLPHLFELARQARIGVLVDHASQVQALAAELGSHAVSLDVYVEVDVGAKRCGVAPGEAVARLAQQIKASRGLRFAGLHCYHGAAQHLRLPEQRAAAIGAAVEAARISRQAVEACGIAVECITGAGTGSFVHERDSGVFNKIQPGSYIFMDRDYGDNQMGEGDIRFEHALFVCTTVMSRVTDAFAVVDAGLKASSVDSGMPFNDHYGYWRGDEMIRLMAGLALGHCDAQRDFVGHVGGDDFIMLFQSDDWEQRCERLVADFNARAVTLYDEAGRTAGGIEAEDRQGVMRFFPFTSLSIGAVRIRKGQYRTAELVASAAASAKHEAKLAGAGLVVRRAESCFAALAD